jgi:transposase
MTLVLKTGIPWDFLPKETGCGSGMTCRRRLRDWHRACVLERLHRRLPGEMRGAGWVDFTAAIADSASVRAVRGAL